jgi:hypothetical protein
MSEEDRREQERREAERLEAMLRARKLADQQEPELDWDEIVAQAKQNPKPAPLPLDLKKEFPTLRSRRTHPGQIWRVGPYRLLVGPEPDDAYWADLQLRDWEYRTGEDATLLG